MTEFETELLVALRAVSDELARLNGTLELMEPRISEGLVKIEDGLSRIVYRLGMLPPER